MQFQEASLAGTKEFGLLEEYEKLEQEKCRPFNRITINGDVLVKEAVDVQGEILAARERAWYDKAAQNQIDILPVIYKKKPLEMEYIKGKNIYECNLRHDEKKQVLQKLVTSLQNLHQSEAVSPDSFSMKEAYYTKTMHRLARLEDLVPVARERVFVVNGKK